ncbi:MAG: alpha/beta hydrolase [Caulobacteraceae bacterium]
MTSKSDGSVVFAPNHPGASWAALNQAERDAAYNNAAAVSDSLEVNRARNVASKAYRDAQPGLKECSYGQRPRERYDLYPAADPNAWCLVFFHGGYWQMNSREDFACVAEGLASHGWSAALPGYTLAPEASLKQIADEVFASLDWLAKNGESVGIGPNIIVSGWSAGAQLATLALGHPAVKGGIAISGVYELAPLRDTYLNGKLALNDQEIEALSPCRTQVTDKPLVVAYGTAELPAMVEDARALHAHRSSAHAPGALLPIPRANHYTTLDQLRRPDGVLTRAALEMASGL